MINLIILSASLALLMPHSSMAQQTKDVTPILLERVQSNGSKAPNFKVTRTCQLNETNRTLITKGGFIGILKRSSPVAYDAKSDIKNADDLRRLVSGLAGEKDIGKSSNAGSGTTTYYAHTDKDSLVKFARLIGAGPVQKIKASGVTSLIEFIDRNCKED